MVKMANKNLSFVQNYIANLCASSDKLRNIFVELEESLAEKKELQLTKDRLQVDMQNLRVDLMLVRQAANVMHEVRKNTESSAQILESSYHHLLEMITLLKDDKMKNISYFSVLCKQNEVQTKLTRMETLQQCAMELNAVMECRTIVKEFRKCQQLLKDAEEKNANTKIESAQIEQQWTIKIKRATQQRNKKIVALIKLRQQITEAQKEITMSDYETAMIVKNLSKKALVPLCKRAKLPLQSALEFISNCFECNSDNGITKFAEPKVPNLRSILTVNRGHEGLNETVQIPILMKQVHFAPSPSPVQEDTSVISLESTVRENDENAVYMELFSRPSVVGRANKPNADNRVNILSVEDLPKFKLPSITQNVDAALNFKRLFSSNEFNSENISEAGKEFENFDQQSKFKDFINIFKLSPEQSKDEFVTNNANNFNTLHFPPSNCASNDDFFLNFDDASCNEPKHNKNSYEL